MTEIRISVPEGMVIDEENSTFECIKFRPIQKRWRDDKANFIAGYYISEADSSIVELTTKCHNTSNNYGTFATKELAKSVLAAARISQIMANDKRFGGAVTTKEWNSGLKYVIERWKDKIVTNSHDAIYGFLAFHTKEQRDLFMEENMDLIKAYYML